MAAAAERVSGFPGVPAFRSPSKVNPKPGGMAPEARARSMTSGPIPAGSPKVMAMWGTAESIDGAGIAAKRGIGCQKTPLRACGIRDGRDSGRSA